MGLKLDADKLATSRGNFRFTSRQDSGFCRTSDYGMRNLYSRDRVSLHQKLSVGAHYKLYGPTSLIRKLRKHFGRRRKTTRNPHFRRGSHFSRKGCVPVHGGSTRIAGCDLC